MKQRVLHAAIQASVYLLVAYCYVSALSSVIHV
jgi:hypothetical protein